MPIQNVAASLLEGFAGAAGDQNVVNSIEASKARSRDLDDQHRLMTIKDSQQRQMNIAQTLSAGVNPDTGKPLTAQEKAELAREHGELNAYVQDLFNPNQAVGKMGKNLSTASGVPLPTGMARRLTDRLGITKPSAVPSGRTTGDVMKEVGAGTSRFAGPPAPPNPYSVMKRNLIAAGTPEDKAAQIVEEKARKDAGEKQAQDLWTQHDVTLSNGQRVTAQQNRATGDWTYLTGEKIPPELLKGALAVPKPAPVKGMAYDANTGQVVNKDTGQRYSRNQANLPPEIKQMFADQAMAAEKKKQDLIQEATARGTAYQAGKYQAFQDPDNPGQNVMLPVARGAAMGLHPASGASYQVMVSTMKAATTGKIGEEMVAFNTALQHADLLEQAANALGNGDVRKLNQVQNVLKTQFGDASVTNFNAIRDAYVREITKALTSGHITDNEIQMNGLSIPPDASPEQLIGAINTYRALMNSKIGIRRQQITSGMQGNVPFMPTGQQNPGELKTPPKASNAKPRRSIAQAKLLPQFKGKSDAEVKKAIESYGYEAVP